MAIKSMKKLINFDDPAEMFALGIVIGALIVLIALALVK